MWFSCQRSRRRSKLDLICIADGLATCFWSKSWSITIKANNAIDKFLSLLHQLSIHEFISVRNCFPVFPDDILNIFHLQNTMALEHLDELRFFEKEWQKKLGCWKATVRKWQDCIDRRCTSWRQWNDWHSLDRAGADIQWRNVLFERRK